MKNRMILHALLSALLILGAGSCRTSKNARSTADSTVTRTEQLTHTWDDMQLTEMIIEPGDSLDSALELPEIFGLSPEQTKAAFSRLAQVQKPEKQKGISSKTKAGKTRGRVIFRQLQKASGTVAMQKQEQKQVKTTQADKSSQPNATGLLGVHSIAFILLLVIIIIYFYRKH